MAGALWYVRNDTLHNDLQIETAKETIRKLAVSYEERLLKHTNILVIQLLEAPLISRLKRLMPPDLVT